MRNQRNGTLMLRQRLNRAVRSGVITQAEAQLLWTRRNGTRPSMATAASASLPATTAPAPVLAATTAEQPVMPDLPPGASAAAPTSEQSCRPVLCRNAAGELVWRRRGRCGQGVVEDLGRARHQVVEVSDAGDLLPPLSGEDPLW